MGAAGHYYLCIVIKEKIILMGIVEAYSAFGKIGKMSRVVRHDQNVARSEY